MKSHFQLVRVYGGIEPALLPEKISPDAESLRKAMIAHLKSEPYDDEDGMFYIEVEDGAPITMHAFGAMEMEKMRMEAEKSPA